MIDGGGLCCSSRWNSVLWWLVNTLGVEVEVVVEVEMIRLKNVVAVFGERTLGRKRKEHCGFEI
jgi:hypothetical protein